MAALVHNLTKKILSEGSAKLRWARRGAGELIFLWSSGKKSVLDVGGPSSIDCNIFGGRKRSSEAAMGGGGAQCPVWRGNKPKKPGARSARARTRGQNPLVIK
jgi:hypothetical protein